MAGESVIRMRGSKWLSARPTKGNLLPRPPARQKDSLDTLRYIHYTTKRRICTEARRVKFLVDFGALKCSIDAKGGMLVFGEADSR